MTKHTTLISNESYDLGVYKIEVRMLQKPLQLYAVLPVGVSLELKPQDCDQKKLH